MWFQSSQEPEVHKGDTGNEMEANPSSSKFIWPSFGLCPSPVFTAANKAETSQPKGQPANQNPTP